MKKTVIIALLVAGCSLAANGYTGEAPRKAAASPAAPKAREAKHSGSGHVFTGRVAGVDVTGRTFALKDKGAMVAFDASNPTFTGYRSLSDMQMGDSVAVSYTSEGIRVRKLSGRDAKGVAAEEKAAAQKTTRTREGLLKKVRTGDGAGFDDADVNKDGKVTTVELSVVVRQITVDEFRQYDRNNDGWLNRTEFFEAVKHLKTRDR